MNTTNNKKKKPININTRVFVNRRFRRRRISPIELRRRRLQARRDRRRQRRQRVKQPINKVQRMKVPGLSDAAKSYMHCRLDPFSSSGALGIPDLSDQPRVVVDHRLICNFVAGNSGGFNIAIMPWLPHPILVRPLTMDDPQWLFNGYHPTSNNSGLHSAQCYFAPATFNEWATQRVNREATTAYIDTINVPYDSKRFRFVTIGAKIIYTGSTMNNAGTMLVNDGSYTTEITQNNNQTFTFLTNQSTGTVAYSPDEVSVTQYHFDPSFTVRSNSSLNAPLKTGGYLLLKNQASDHPWLPILNALNFPTWQGLNDNCPVIGNTADPLTTLTAEDFPCVQAWDEHFCPKLVSIQGLAQGTPFQIELVYCVEYAIDPSSSVVSLAKQPPADPVGLQRVDAYVRDRPSNTPLSTEIVKTIGTTVSDSIGHIANAFSPKNAIPHMTFERSTPMISEY